MNENSRWQQMTERLVQAELEIALTPQARELLESEEIDTADIHVIELVAFRDGDPLDWERPENGYEIVSRVCRTLDIKRISDDISEVSEREAVRQKGVFSSAQNDKLERERLIQLEKSTERGMGQTATLLVEALVAPDDPRDRDEIRAQVLRALMPIQDQIDNHYHPRQVIR